MTLMELIIVLALLSIISLMVLSIFIYVLNIYQKAIDKRNEQFEVRLVSELITTDVRNADLVGTLSGDGNSFEYVFYLDSGNNVFYKRHYSDTNSDPNIENYVVYDTQKFSDGYIDSIYVDIVPDGTDIYLEFVVEGIYDYRLESQVLLNNITATDYSENGTVAVGYTKTWDSFNSGQ
jgi:hypothetical protein